MSQLRPQYVPRKHLSYSTLLEFVRCPRKYFYKKSGIFPQQEATALMYGLAMHAATDAGVNNGIDEGFRVFSSIWNELLADDKRNLVRARAQLGHYVHTHTAGRSIYKLLPPPEGTVQADDKTSPNEIPFVIDVGLSVPIVGRLDGWCRHRDTGEYWGREFKTTSRISASMFDSLELNPQLLIYALVLKTLAKKTIKGIMFECMLIDAKKVDNMTHPVTIADHHIPEIATWLRYWGSLLLACEERAEIIKLAAHEPEDDTINAIIHEMSSAFPKNFAGCNAYSLFYMPGSSCEYQNLCRVADWRHMLPFYEVRWDARDEKVELTIGGASAIAVTG